MILPSLLMVILMMGQEPVQAPRIEKTEDLKPTPPPSEGLFGLPIRGQVAGKYRFRSSSDDRDQDLYAYLTLDYADAAKDRVTAHLFLRATKDLDGDSSPEGYYSLDGITGSYDGSLNARLYEAHVDVHRVGSLSVLRGGRQFLQDAPVQLHFDGIRVETQVYKEFHQFKSGAYAGVPVHLYESSPAGDSLVGLFAELRPWTGSRFRLDLLRTADEVGDEDFSETLVGIGAWQAFASGLRTSAEFTLLEGNSHDLRLRANYYDKGLDLRVDVSYTQLFHTQERLSVENDFYFLALMSYAPYGQTRVLVSKGFGEHLVLQATLDARELIDPDDDAPNNREFRHVTLGPVVTDWPNEKMSWSLFLDVWEVPGSDAGDIVTATFDLSRKFSDGIKGSLGTSFAEYTYDYFSATEREKVRTVYLRVAYVPRKGEKYGLSWEYENDDLDDFHVVKLGVGYSF